MKKRILFTSLIAATLVFSCEQEIAELQPPAEPSGEPGSADFTMFVSIGNSLTAGFQAGALFNVGQANSYPAIMAKQFAIVSNNDEFNQPDINSVNGCYNPTTCSRGRLVLFDPDGTGPKTPAPAPAGTPGIPAPYNTSDVITPFGGDKTKLNNFGVPGILLGQALIPDTGNPASPFFNGLWARFASQPGAKTILDDAIAKNPTFFSFWLGNNDVLGYATTGGSGAVGLTPSTTFQAQYTTAINQLLNANANIKGIVATIPDVTTIPFFTTVKFNAVPLDAATAGAVNAGFAGYNAALTGIQSFPPANLAALGLSVAGLESRKVSFAASATNSILMNDESLVDLGNAFDALQGAGAINATQRAQLAPYEQARQANNGDIITLSAGAILGTTVGGNPQLVNGVSVPLADQYVLHPLEITAIKDATVAFNVSIVGIVAANSSRLALADVNAKFTSVVTRTTTSVDGVPVNATFAPPTGLFSEDGVHLTTEGRLI